VKKYVFQPAPISLFKMFANQRRTRLKFGANVILLLILFVSLGGCVRTTPSRLQEVFDSETLGSLPLQYPLPNPPADRTDWNSEHMRPRIVQRDTGGNWVMVQPEPSYFKIPARWAGKPVAQVLSAFSDVFRYPGANISGHLALRLVGNGVVRVYLRDSQDQDRYNGQPLGGIDVTNTAIWSGIWYRGHWNLPSNDYGPTGNWLASYVPGQTLVFMWSIAQSGPLFNINVAPKEGGPAESIQLDFDRPFPAPLRRILLLIEAYGFENDTRLFVDNISVEEEEQ
jgi:hypothetical protein